MSTEKARLWSRLRLLRAQGRHFRWQPPLLGYFPDFVCFAQRLVVEVDGSYPEGSEQAGREARRDQVLLRAGFQTLRFPTRAVHEDIDAVMGVICQALDAASPARPLRGHLPHEGEGRVSDWPPARPGIET